MSQQINLLRPKDRTGREAIAAAAVVGAFLLGMVGYYQSAAGETGVLRALANAKADQVVQLKQGVLRMQTEKNKEGDADALAQEIASLKPRVEAVSGLVKEVQDGSLGSAQGFARQYQLLSSVSEPGLWLTNVAISKGGTSVTIGGRALRHESVMQYARRLNEAFTSYGVQFNSLQITPEAVSKPGAPAPALTTVGFRLS